MVDTQGAPKAGRRDIVLVGAAAFAGMGGLFALWPFIAQMNPGADVPPPQKLDVDVLSVAEGRILTVSWQGRPITLLHRSRADIERAGDTPTSGLIDGVARNAMLPADASATDANRTLKGHPDWLVVVALCTHEGCVLAKPELVAMAPAERFACPCCNARFDVSGRVISGPARSNLAIPRYEIISPSQIRLL